MQNLFSNTITRNTFKAHPQEVSTKQNCDEKTLQMLRTALISELTAISDYTMWANEIPNENIKKVLKSIRDEERVHAGELQELIALSCPEESTLFQQGKDEVKQMLNINIQNY